MSYKADDVTTLAGESLLDLASLMQPLNTARSNHQRAHRNARLAAAHSLFRFAALVHPQDAAVIQRVLAIPPKRFDQTLITYLTEPETDALLAALDQSTWTGRRDHALLALAIHTGLRVSELTALTCAACTWEQEPTSVAWAKAENSGSRR